MSERIEGKVSDSGYREKRGANSGGRKPRRVFMGRER